MEKDHEDEECPGMRICRTCKEYCKLGEVKEVIYFCNSKTAKTFCKNPDKLPECNNHEKARRGCPDAICCVDQQI